MQSLVTEFPYEISTLPILVLMKYASSLKGVILRWNEPNKMGLDLKILYLHKLYLHPPEIIRVNLLTSFSGFRIRGLIYKWSREHRVTELL